MDVDESQIKLPKIPTISVSNPAAGYAYTPNYGQFSTPVSKSTRKTSTGRRKSSLKSTTPINVNQLIDEPKTEKSMPTESGTNRSDLSATPAVGGTGSNNPSQPLLIPPPLPKLCPSCSAALVTYLLPLQRYINDIVQLSANVSGTVIPPPTVITLGQPPPGNAGQQQQQQSTVDIGPSPAGFVGSNQNVNVDYNQQHHQGRPASDNISQWGDSHKHDSGYDSSHYTASQSAPSQVYGGNDYWHDGGRSEGGSGGGGHADSRPGGQYHDGGSGQQHYGGQSSDPSHRDGGNQHHESGSNQVWQQDHGNNQNQHHQSSGDKQSDGNPNQYHDQVPPPPPPPQHDTGGSNESQNSQSDFRPSQTTQQGDGNVSAPSQPSTWRGVQPETAPIPYRTPEVTAYDEFFSTMSPSPEAVAGFDDGTDSSQFAIVTIAYNNLSAINCVILANSLILTNNRSIVVRGRSHRISFVVLTSGYIDPNLRHALNMVYDSVQNVQEDYRISLMYDRTLGSQSQQIKTQLWRTCVGYSKCIFLEHFTMAVGNLAELFIDADELSACVDSSCPDLFNCSVFVFEPSNDTYEQLVQYTVREQEKLPGQSIGEADVIDEVSVLNGFFAQRWKRLSFIYNFTPSQSVYTQTPAFLKFGGQVRVVNFGQMAMLNYSAGGNGNGGGTMPGAEPWHVAFDLIESETYDHVKTSGRVTAYYKFYLNIFMKRLWPLLRHYLTPLMRSAYGSSRRYWSVYEMALVMLRELDAEMDDYLFSNNVLSFQRLKSPTEKLNQYRFLERDHREGDLAEYEKRERERIAAREAAEQRQREAEAAESAAVTATTEPDPTTEKDTTRSETTSETVSDTGAGNVGGSDAGSEATVTTAAPDEDKPSDGDGSSMSPMSDADRAALGEQERQREFQEGRIDWMGAHNSDRIIARIRNQIARKSPDK